MSSATDPSTSPPTLLTIDGVTASQIIGDSQPQPLATGTLSVLPGAIAGSSGSTDAGDDQSPLLLLKIESSLFPLYKDTIFGTHDGKEEWYTFSLRVGTKDDAASGSSPSMWVRLVLPPLTTPELTSRRDQFEQHLIARGLLLDGIRATGDELGRASAQSGAQAARSVHQSAATHQTTTDPTDSPWQFSRLSHDASKNFKASTGTVAEYTTAASQAVSGLAASAGSAVGSAFASAKGSLMGGDGGAASGEASNSGGSDQSTRVMPNTRDAVSDAASGVGQG